MTDTMARGAPGVTSELAQRPGRALRRPAAYAGPIPFTQRLGFRLAALIAVALLPLGIISLLQADAWLVAARDQRAAVLMGDTLRVSSPITGLVREAQGTAAALARTVPALLGDEEACDAALTQIAAQSPQYSVVGFVPLDGRMTCAANGAAYNYAGDPLFDVLIARQRPTIVVIPNGYVSGTSILLVVQPVTDLAGAAQGYMALALPHDALEAVPPAGPSSEASPREAPDFVTFNDAGEVLTSSLGLDRADEILPADVDLQDYLESGHSAFTARTEAGQERFYAVVPLVEGQLYALGSVSGGEAVRLGPVSIFTPFLLAALMWVGSLAVAWIAAEQLVTRYIRRLGRAIRAFASGSRVVGDLDMEGAPAEIREVGQAFLRMTDTILHDEAELEDTVHQREVLLREVHHRVKNNLQLIASIMNMQARRAKNPETKALMKGLQERVMSLATVHKELYQTTGLTDVRADELLSDLVRQIVGMASGPGRTFRIETDFAPLHLVPDQAVPLALLLTEGLTNALKYAEPAPGEPSPRLTIRFEEQPEGRAKLSIVNTAPNGAIELPPDGTGLGKQLVAAFATQLGGDVRTEAKDGQFELQVEFVLRPLHGAEQRHSG